MPRSKKVSIPEHIWAGVDWVRPNVEIAAEFQVATSTVVRNRARHAPHTIEDARGNTAAKHIDWNQVDWSLGNKTIAGRLGVTDASVVTQRRKHAPETRYHPLTREGLVDVDWTSVEWERHDDHEIQKSTGASHSTVIRQRKVVAPHTLARSRVLTEDVWATEDDETIAARYRVSRSTVRKWREEQAPATMPQGEATSEMSEDRYVRLEMPEGWRPTLERLRERPAPALVARTFPLPTALRDALNELPARQRVILNARFGFEATMEAVGERFGFTRQRADQLQKIALRALLKATSGIQDDLVDALRHLKDTPDAAPLVLPNDLEHRRRLNLAIHSHPILKPNQNRTLDYLILSHQPLERWERRVAHLLKELQHHETPERVEDQLELPAGSTRVLLHTSGHLYLTRHDHLGLRAWPIRSYLSATALEIALHHPESAPWHVSQLLAAAQYHHPRELESTTVPGALNAIRSHAPDNPFIYAGQRGTYNLRVLQLDDDPNNLTATARVFLDASHRTLHFQEAFERLTHTGRAIRLGTLGAILSREPYYQSDGEGRYTIHPDRIPPEHDPNRLDHGRDSGSAEAEQG